MFCCNNNNALLAGSEFLKSVYVCMCSLYAKMQDVTKSTVIVHMIICFCRRLLIRVTNSLTFDSRPVTLCMCMYYKIWNSLSAKSVVQKNHDILSAFLYSVERTKRYIKKLYLSKWMNEWYCKKCTEGRLMGKFVLNFRVCCIKSFLFSRRKYQNIFTCHLFIVVSQHSTQQRHPNETSFVPVYRPE